MYSSKIIACNTNLGFAETLLSKRENFSAWIKCYPSPSSTKNANRTLLGQAGFRTRKWSPFQVSCSRERDISVIEAGLPLSNQKRRPTCKRADAIKPEQLHVSLGLRKIYPYDGCMDDIYDCLAEHLVPTAAAASSPNFKHIVGLAGPPGAGKSTIASEIAKRVNKLWSQKSRSFDSQVEPPEVAIVLPMDGFHLYRHQLDAMEDPEEAHARRGAPWTFDPNLLLECLKTLKDQGSVYCPSFDHGVGDPVEDDIFVNLQHKIVIVEGNYLLLGDGAWKELSSMFDEKWFVDVDIEKAMQRVLTRHISTGKPPDAAKWRIDYNDRPNAELIMKSKKNADLVIKSIDELR